MKQSRILLSLVLIMSVCLGSVSCSEENTGDITLTETSAAVGVQPAAATVNALSSEEDAPPVFRNGTDGIDIDITVLSSTMVYSVVYSMISAPSDYLGMVVKMDGQFAYFHDDYTGNDYYSCIIQDATACCSQGLEFVPEDADNYTYPDDFPAVGDQITVTGTFDIYQENGITYCTLRNASLCAD